jgi:hypothetical protein
MLLQAEIILVRRAVVQLLFDTDGDVLNVYINTELISYPIVKHWQVALLQTNCISKILAVAHIISVTFN